MKKINGLDVFRVTEALLQTGSYEDMDDLLQEMAQDVSRYENTALLAALSQSRFERHRFSNRDALYAETEKKMNEELGVERTEKVLRPYR